MSFLKKKSSINSFNALKSHERTLFHLIQKQDFDLFRQIVDSQEVNPDIRDQQGNTLLIHSVDDDLKIQFTKYLILKGANLNAVDNKGMSALFKAVYWGEKETVKILVNKKEIDLDQENEAFSFLLNPLAASIFKNNVEITKILLYNGADPFKAERIISLNYNVFKDSYSQQSQDMVEFYKRWQKGKRQILLAYYFSKNKKSYKKETKNIRPFDVGVLPKQIVVKIAAEFL